MTELQQQQPDTTPTSSLAEPTGPASDPSRIAPADALIDSGGGCLPGAPGDSVDLAAALWAQRQQRRALALCEQQADRVDSWHGRYLQALRQILLQMPGEQMVAVFRPAVAGLALSPDRRNDDPMGTALGLIRFLVGGPNMQDLALVIPAQAFATRGRLYFPHLHALVESRGPLAIEADCQEVRFTWADGAGATLSTMPPAHDPGSAGERITLLPSVCGLRVLNGTPDLELPLPELPAPALPWADPEQMDNLANGIVLLEQVWPAMALACRRYLDSAVLQPLPAEGHVTSVTLGRLQGSLIGSMRDPVQVADALCHEGSHNRLGLLLQFDSLIEDDGAEVHPSPWRPDLRPLKGVVNGVHAFINVCEFYQRLAQSEPGLEAQALEVYQEQRHRVLEAWDYMQPHLHPTPIGRSLIADLQKAVEALR